MNTAESVAVSPTFRTVIEDMRAKYFSRNPDLWPVFRDPGLAAMLAFRREETEGGDRIAAYPDGPAHYHALRSQKAVPESPATPGTAHGRLLFTGALSKVWENPCSVENVITMPSDPAIYGAMIAATANPNLVYSEYAGMAEELERTVVRQIASLAGYDPERATGVFTQGGTFCNMYGYLFGIRKAMPESIHLGLEYGQDYRIINSQGGHYSNTTNLSVLGVNLKKKTIRIRLTDSNTIDLVDLEQQLTACFRLGCLVPTIMLTMGTTDTFGVDPVKPVHDLCVRLVEKFPAMPAPHIHVDAAVGWPIIFFLDYDFEKNPLDINAATLAGLRRSTDRFRELRYADSFTVDFQKWGFVPYTSSLVMVKDKASMKALEHDPENFSYFEKDTQGNTHLQSTIECSRGAGGVFAAYSALQYIGKSGYRALIAHGLQNANYLRHKLANLPGVVLLAPENQGPSVAFRLYDTAEVKDVWAELDYERRLVHSDEYRRRVARNTAYHRNTFLARGKIGLFTNWVESAALTHYDDSGDCDTLPGEKAVFMNPMCDTAQIDAFVARLHGRQNTSQSSTPDCPNRTQAQPPSGYPQEPSPRLTGQTA